MRHSILLHNKQKKFSHNTPSNSHFGILANICGLLSTCCMWHSVLSQLDQNKEVVPFGDGFQLAWSSLALAVGIAVAQHGPADSAHYVVDQTVVVDKIAPFEYYFMYTQRFN